MKIMNKCVFLDRDNTINVDSGYTYLPSELVIKPDVPEALKIIRDKGFLLIVITNQSGIAKGKYALKDVERFHEEINKQLMRMAGVCINDFYICPHHLSGTISPFNIVCKCRKPQPGLIYKASKEYNIDLSTSYMIGDKDCDIELGNHACLKKSFRVHDHISMLNFAKEIT